MFGINIAHIHSSTLQSIETYSPKILGALIIILIGGITSIAIYKTVMLMFKKFRIIELIDRLNVTFEHTKNKGKKVKNAPIRKKISDKIKINEIISKAFSYYIFLVFFRLSIVVIGIKEIEDFLGELLRYLPSLFIAIVIGFFGMKFANFIHDLVYHALDLTKQKTAKIISGGAKIIVLFFTLMVVLSKIGIATEITNTILIGFISMLALAGGIAFGLGGKDIAHEILESFRNE